MKKILLSLVMLASTSAFAYGHHGYWRHTPGYGWSWVVPAVVGGVVVYEATRPVVVQQPPVVVQQPPVVVQQQDNCSPWTETKNPDGTITTTRTCQVLPR